MNNILSPAALAYAKSIGLISVDETLEDKVAREEQLAAAKTKIVALVEKYDLRVVPPGPESLKMLCGRIKSELRRNKES